MESWGRLLWVLMGGGWYHVIMFVCSYNILSRFEDAIDGFKMIFDGDSSWLLGWMMGYTLICAVSNYSGLMVTTQLLMF